MNEPDEFLRAHFARQRETDAEAAPDFRAMSRRARSAAPSAPRSLPRLLLWPAAAGLAVLLAVALVFPRHTAPSYSARIGALSAEFEILAFDRTPLPSDLLPTAFSEP